MFDLILIALPVLAVEVGGALFLLWLAKRTASNWVAVVCTLFVSLAAASSMAIALQSFAMHGNGFFKEPNLWPAFVWLLLGLFGFAIAGAARPSPWLVASPFYLIGVLFLGNGLLHREPYGGMMGLFMISAGLIANRVFPGRTSNADTRPCHGRA